MNTSDSLKHTKAPAAKNRTSFYMTVFALLTFHAALVGALLVQGCKEKAPAPQPDVPAKSEVSTPASADTNVAALTPALPPGPSSNTIPVVPVSPATSLPPAPPQPPVAGTPAAPSPAAPAVPAIPSPVAPATMEPPTPAVPAATGAENEYTVAKGDIFATIAKKFGVSIKAIAEANPGVDSRKLKIGQKLKIPAKAEAAPAVAGAAPAASAEGDAPYVVKKGDTLEKIAKAHNSTVKMIQSANHLTTTMIREGQKLKVPAKAAPAAAAEPAPAPAPVVPATPTLPTPPAVPTAPSPALMPPAAPSNQ